MLPEPTTSSPGFLKVNFLPQNWPDSKPLRFVRFRIVDGMMPGSAGEAASLASEAAQEIAKLCCKNSYTYQGWELEGPDYGTLLTGSPLFLVQGTLCLGGNNGSPSRFLTFLGETYPPDISLKKGHTRAMIFISDAWAIIPGRREYTIADIGTWGDFAAYLNSQASLFADKYGRKCHCLPYSTLTYNAALQAFRGA